MPRTSNKHIEGTISVFVKEKKQAKKLIREIVVDTAAAEVTSAIPTTCKT
jgi:hypothetical protein